MFSSTCLLVLFRFSGVTKDHLQDVTTNLQDIHDIFQNLLHKDTILLGHSLESDLNALKVTVAGLENVFIFHIR